MKYNGKTSTSCPKVLSIPNSRAINRDAVLVIVLTDFESQLAYTLNSVHQNSREGRNSSHLRVRDCVFVLFCFFLLVNDLLRGSNLVTFPQRLKNMYNSFKSTVLWGKKVVAVSSGLDVLQRNLITWWAALLRNKPNCFGLMENWIPKHFDLLLCSLNLSEEIHMVTTNKKKTVRYGIQNFWYLKVSKIFLHLT